MSNKKKDEDDHKKKKDKSSIGGSIGEAAGVGVGLAVANVALGAVIPPVALAVAGYSAYRMWSGTNTKAAATAAAAASAQENVTPVTPNTNSSADKACKHTGAEEEDTDDNIRKDGDSKIAEPSNEDTHMGEDYEALQIQQAIEATVATQPEDITRLGEEFEELQIQQVLEATASDHPETEEDAAPGQVQTTVSNQEKDAQPKEGGDNETSGTTTPHELLQPDDAVVVSTEDASGWEMPTEAMLDAKDDDPSHYDDAVVALALHNYEQHYQLDPGTATYQLVNGSFAGILGWAAFADGNAPAEEEASLAASGTVVKTESSVEESVDQVTASTESAVDSATAESEGPDGAAGPNQELAEEISDDADMPRLEDLRAQFQRLFGSDGLMSAGSSQSPARPEVVAPPPPEKPHMQAVIPPAKKPTKENEEPSTEEKLDELIGTIADIPLLQEIAVRHQYRIEQGIDCSKTASVMQGNPNSPEMQLIGCLDLRAATERTDVDVILKSGLVQAVIIAMGHHTNMLDIQKEGSKALHTLMRKCSSAEKASLKELGALEAVLSASQILRERRIH